MEFAKNESFRCTENKEKLPTGINNMPYSLNSMPWVYALSWKLEQGNSTAKLRMVEEAGPLA